MSSEHIAVSYANLNLFWRNLLSLGSIILTWFQIQMQIICFHKFIQCDLMQILNCKYERNNILMGWSTSYNFVSFSTYRFPSVF